MCLSRQKWCLWQLLPIIPWRYNWLVQHLICSWACWALVQLVVWLSDIVWLSSCCRLISTLPPPSSLTRSTPSAPSEGRTRSMKPAVASSQSCWCRWMVGFDWGVPSSSLAFWVHFLRRCWSWKCRVYVLGYCRLCCLCSRGRKKMLLYLAEMKCVVMACLCTSKFAIVPFWAI